MDHAVAREELTYRATPVARKVARLQMALLRRSSGGRAAMRAW